MKIWLHSLLKLHTSISRWMEKPERFSLSRPRYGIYCFCSSYIHMSVHGNCDLDVVPGKREWILLTPCHSLIKWHCAVYKLTSFYNPLTMCYIHIILKICVCFFWTILFSRLLDGSIPGSSFLTQGYSFGQVSPISETLGILFQIFSKCQVISEAFHGVGTWM